MGTIIRFYDPHKENGYLSNWFISPFSYAGRDYFSCEQYLMEQKALTFGDDEIAEKIMKSKNLTEIKRLGKQVARYNENLWKTIRPQVMRRGLRAKFQQNPELLLKLLGTGNAILAECAPRDAIWGIGLGIDDPRSEDTKEWRGRNLLGRALMRVREDLRAWSAVAGEKVTEYVDAVDLKQPKQIKNRRRGRGGDDYEPAPQKDDVSIWSMRIYEACMLPYVSEIVSTWLEEVFYDVRHGHSYEDLGITNYTFESLEQMFRNERINGIPFAGFYEMKQDLFDLMRYQGGLRNPASILARPKDADEAEQPAIPVVPEMKEEPAIPVVPETKEEPVVPVVPEAQEELAVSIAVMSEAEAARLVSPLAAAAKEEPVVPIAPMSEADAARLVSPIAAKAATPEKPAPAPKPVTPAVKPAPAAKPAAPVAKPAAKTAAPAEPAVKLVKPAEPVVKTPVAPAPKQTAPIEDEELKSIIAKAKAEEAAAKARAEAARQAAVAAKYRAEQMKARAQAAFEKAQIEAEAKARIEAMERDRKIAEAQAEVEKVRESAEEKVRRVEEFTKGGSRRQVAVIQGKLVDTRCEGLVNVTTQTLSIGKGVDEEFYEKGGAELKRACMSLKGCETGKAVLTIGGGLPAKYVIHTACPRFGGDGSDKKYLEKCYTSVMDLAMANNIHDIAMPPIGAGYFGYPLRECAIVASQTVDRWMLKHADYPLKITFVCPDQRTEAMFLSMRK